MSGLRVGIRGLHSSTATLEALVALHGNRVYKLAYHLTGTTFDAEDVLQEVFFRLLRRWTVPASCVNEAAWITRVTTNASIDVLRARRARGRNIGMERLEQVPAPDERPGHSMETRELNEKLEEALATLPPRQLAALILYDHEDLKSREVGRILRISESAVRGYVFEARRKVKERLTPYLRGSSA